MLTITVMSVDKNTSSYYGEGPYYNIKKGIILQGSKDKGNGLFATEAIPNGTIVWSNRPDGPSEKYYKPISIKQVENMTDEEKNIFIRYGYQIDDDTFHSPLNQHEIDLDFSNYWNHSCDPNCLPLNEDTWIAIRNININEELTIDYCTFDSNIYNCIDKCMCGSPICRTDVRGDDYKKPELQLKYADYFLPFIQEKINALNNNVG